MHYCYSLVIFNLFDCFPLNQLLSHRQFPTLVGNVSQELARFASGAKILGV